MNKISYQKSENDCWVCALKNFLYFLDVKIAEKEIFSILEKKNLDVYGGRVFFTYLPIVLDELCIDCKFIIDSDNELLRPILLDKEILLDDLDTCVRALYVQKNALYYYYKSLKMLSLSSHIELNIDIPNLNYYLEKQYVVAACLRLSQLYGLDQNSILHMITIVKNNRIIKVIDPYDKIGDSQELNWELYKEYRNKLDWSMKVPYYIAAKRKI